MSFQDAYNVFVSGMSGSQLLKYTTLNNYENFAEKMDLSVQSDNNVLKLDVDLSADSKVNKKSLNYISKLALNAIFDDKIKKDHISTSGTIKMSMIDNNMFVKIDNADVNLGAGNAE